jgi:hypothetical protein
LHQLKRPPRLRPDGLTDDEVASIEAIVREAFKGFED